VNKQNEVMDLSARLYYCSDSKEGNKMRKWVEKRIEKLEKEIKKERIVL